MSLPDLLTLANASSGFLAIVFVLMGDLILSAKLILLATIFDALDGWLARKMKRDDQYGFGENIDSLSDMISFGIAPGILLYSATLSYGIQYINIVVALLVVIGGILRLSRFNVLVASGQDSEGKFIGLPIPCTALILGSYYLSGVFRPDIALVIMTVVALLMVSTVEYPKFKGKNLVVGGILLIITIFLTQNLSLAIANLPAKLLLVITLIYLLIVPLMDLYAKFLRSGPHVR